MKGYFNELKGNNEMLKQYLEKFNVKDELLVNAIIDLFIEQFNCINYIHHNIIYLLVMCENILKVKYTDSGIWFKINNRQFILDDGRYI